MIFRTQRIFLVAAIICGVSSCKTVGSKSEFKDDKHPKDFSVSELAEKLSPGQRQIIGEFLLELNAHVRRFQQRPDLTANLQGQLKACGNQRDANYFRYLTSNFSEIRACGMSQLKPDSEFATIAEISKLKRSATLDKLIDAFTGNVLPAFIDAMMQSLENRPKMDDSQVAKILDLVNQVALISKMAVTVVEWRPDYVSSLRYLNQVVLSELSKGRQEDVDWRLVRAATTARLDIFPLAAVEAGLNPVVVPLKDPLYKVLYGPTPRGAAYWIMLAASTVRLHSYECVPEPYDLVPRVVNSLDVIPRQILLESPADQKIILNAIKYLTDNFKKVI